MTEIFKRPRTGPDHYAEAQRLLAMSWEDGRQPENIAHILASAQVHATLALAAATALNDGDGGSPVIDYRAWIAAASVTAEDAS